MAKFHALILAKGKSKRLRSKNTLDFHGEPMFAVNVRKCLALFDKVYVSSDDAEILKYADKLGAIPIYRSESLCGDAPNIPVYRHAVQFMADCDGIVAVQANSPTVGISIIENVRKQLEDGAPEVITINSDGSIYGSVWGMTLGRLAEYKDFYNPKPEVKVVDDSVDIHTKDDYKKALQWQSTQAL